MLLCWDVLLIIINLLDGSGMVYMYINYQTNKLVYNPTIKIVSPKLKIPQITLFWDEVKIKPQTRGRIFATARFGSATKRSHIPPMILILWLFLCVWSKLLTGLNTDKNIEPWNLPLLPTYEIEIGDEFKNTLGKKIPRHLWMAFKDIPKPEDRPDYLTRMFNKNVALNWTLHLADNTDKMNFMEKYYNNTSLLWAYKIIHPKFGNTAADIWRYCVLYLFGGLYMDDDSYFESVWDGVSSYS